VCLLSICQVMDKNEVLVVLEWRVTDCVPGTS
jgi:hypothetical protein